MQIELGTINNPRKIGLKNNRICFARIANRSGIFGNNEILSARQKKLIIKETKKRELAQYGTRIGPNPVFWDPAVYRRVSSRQVRLHNAATGFLAKKYPGFNSARFATEVVLETEAKTDEPEIAVINAHLVPNGHKVNPIWRLRVRRRSLRILRSMIQRHHDAGRIVILMGDMNIRRPFKVMKGWVWLRGWGIDKLGFILPKGYRLTAKNSYAVPAPTDHKRGFVGGLSYSN